MNRSAAPLTPSSDTRTAMPLTPGARADRVRAAIETLRTEERRLARLGLGTALTRCREQMRYWQFLEALFTLPAGTGRAGERA